MPDDIFTALAEPVRRQIVHRLHQEGPLSVTELTAPLTISRQAVTKHLDVLCASGLVQQERHGRERRHRLRPQALKAVADWLQPYAREWDQALQRLQRHLDEPAPADDTTSPGATHL